ncbi:MAG: iron-sulfur cluster repair di-iron protein [Acidobacteriota bacterium]
MFINQNTVVRDVAVAIPASTRVFEKLGIDYCCEGSRPLGEACERSGLNLTEVVRSLEAVEKEQDALTNSRDWNREPLALLIEHIVQKHHAFTKEELGRLTTLLDKVISAHGNNHAELIDVQRNFEALRQELISHMFKEEQILFPHIAAMESALDRKQPLPRPPFGSVQNPVRMMVHEHDQAGTLLQVLRQLTTGYTVPDDACLSYKTLYSALEGFEQDLHLHIHLENNILFPKAAEMEKSIH